jgi:hypothetical protein
LHRGMRRAIRRAVVERLGQVDQFHDG